MFMPYDFFFLILRLSHHILFCYVLVFKLHIGSLYNYCYLMKIAIWDWFYVIFYFSFCILLVVYILQFSFILNVDFIIILKIWIIVFINNIFCILFYGSTLIRNVNFHEFFTIYVLRCKFNFQFWFWFTNVKYLRKQTYKNE